MSAEAMIEVAGRLVTPREFALMELLSRREGTAAHLHYRLVTVGIEATGWSVLGVLTSLEMRRLVECYRRDPCELCWRLTKLGWEPFRNA